MKLLPFTFQPEGDFIEIVGISDLHYGSAHFNAKKAEKHRSYILAHPDRKALDLGDGIENGLRSSPGSSVYKQTCPPSEQRAWLKEWYRPMRERVLGVVAGNHEDRSERESDISPDELLVNFLDCPWIQWEAVLSVTVGDSRHGQNYSIYTRHAISNSSKPPVILGAMFNKSRAIQGCDVYWFAHNHMFMSESLPTLTPDARHGKVRERLQHFVMGDSFLDYDQSYAEQHGFPLPNPGQVALRLYRDRHYVEVVRLIHG